MMKITYHIQYKITLNIKISFVKWFQIFEFYNSKFFNLYKW